VSVGRGVGREVLLARWVMRDGKLTADAPLGSGAAVVARAVPVVARAVPWAAAAAAGRGLDPHRMLYAEDGLDLPSRCGGWSASRVASAGSPAGAVDTP